MTRLRYILSEITSILLILLLMIVFYLSGRMILCCYGLYKLLVIVIIIFRGGINILFIFSVLLFNLFYYKDNLVDILIEFVIRFLSLWLFFSLWSTLNCSVTFSDMDVFEFFKLLYFFFNSKLGRVFVLFIGCFLLYCVIAVVLVKRVVNVYFKERVLTKKRKFLDSVRLATVFLKK